MQFCFQAFQYKLPYVIKPFDDRRMFYCTIYGLALSASGKKSVSSRVGEGFLPYKAGHICGVEQDTEWDKETKIL